MPVSVGFNIETKQRVYLSHTDRFTASYIVGKMGTGKSTLIKRMLMDHLFTGHGMLVMEPKGDLIQDVLEIIPKEREGDVVLLDYGDSRHPPGFDLFDATGLTTIEEKAAYVREVVNGFEKTLGDQSWGSRMETVIMAVAQTFLENPGTTLVQIERLFDDGAFRRRCTRNMRSITSQSARRFWDQYDRTKGKDAYVDSVLTKVRRFLFDPMLLAVTAQTGKSLNFFAAIQERQIVLISLPERRLGEKGVDLLGTLYLSRMRLAMMRQFDIPEAERVPFFVYLDEFQRFAAGDIESFIAEARGAKVGLTMAHQWRSQIDDMGVRTAPMAAGNLFVFQVTPEDAAVFARGFSWIESRKVEEPSPPRPVALNVNFFHDIQGGRHELNWSVDDDTKRECSRRAGEIWRQLYADGIKPNWGRRVDELDDWAVRVKKEPPGEHGRRELLRQIAEIHDAMHVGGVQRTIEELYRVQDRTTAEQSLYSIHQQYGVAVSREWPGLPNEALRAAVVGGLMVWVFRREGGPPWTAEDLMERYFASCRFYWELFAQVLPIDIHRVPYEERKTMPTCPNPADLPPKSKQAFAMLAENANYLADVLDEHPVYRVSPEDHAADVERFNRGPRVTRLDEPRAQDIVKGLANMANFRCHAKIRQGRETVEIGLTVNRVGLAPSVEGCDERTVRERSRRLSCMPMDDALALVATQQGITGGDGGAFYDDTPPTRF